MAGCPARATDHPRVCGEQHIRRLRQRIAMGSPPRVRGAAAKLLQSFLGHRITPACAGSSTWCSTSIP